MSLSTARIIGCREYMPRKLGYHVIKDVQVLTHMHEGAIEPHNNRTFLGERLRGLINSLARS